MRFERVAWVVACAVLAGCPDERASGEQSTRFAGVTTKTAVVASRFCDVAYPAAGEKARAWQPPALRRLEGAPPAAPVKGWRWVNAWATWCTPCVEELGLLLKWRDALLKDGVDVSFELLSIDEAQAEPQLRKWLVRALPGPVSWVKSPDDFPPWLEKSLGVSPDAAIPIHVLVDPGGKVRCVRIGAVHEQDYGAVRAMLGGG